MRQPPSSRRKNILNEGAHMMKGNSKGKSKKFLSLLFATFMLSATATGFASCGDSASSDVDDSEVSITEKDDQRILNGNFEFYDDNDGKNLIVTSPKNWTKSVGSSSKGSASSSKAASGIVDTSKWDVFSETSGLAPSTLDEAKTNWDNLTTRDKLEFIYNWEEEDSDNDAEDLPFYDEDADIFNYNIDFEDVPSCSNPGTHGGEAQEDTSILMIHNKYSDNFGTAQKYTSSSTITLQPGTSAQFSVWVKTSDLTNADSNGDSQETVSDRGAYIGVTNTVSGTTLDQIQVKNIISDEWRQYTFYLKGSTYAESTFTVVLGLGQGGGNKWEYVDGYAFFDDVECKIVKNEEFDDAQSSFQKEIFLNDTAADKLIRADIEANKDVRTIGIDLSTSFSSLTPSFLFKQTEEDKFSGVLDPFGSGITDTSNDLKSYISYDSLKSMNKNEWLSASFDKDFEDYPFEGNILLLYSASGAPYTATCSNFVLLEKGEYKVVSFWVKTSDLTGGFTGGGISLTQEDTKTEVFSSLTTESVSSVDVDGENGTEEDIYKGWQQCFLFLSNTSDKPIKVGLSFTYGPTSIATTSKDAYREGYVAFANFEIANVDKKAYDNASSGTYTKAIALADETSTAGKFDEAAAVPSSSIETGFAPLANYSGVVGGSSYVSWNGTECEKDSYSYAGLLSSEYKNAYTNILPSTATVTASEILKGATQPLVIYNDSSMSYGYIGSVQTVSASDYGTVALRVKASRGAIANIYLIEKTDAGYEDSLSVSTLSYVYYYDADGNVCGKDPTANDFDKKRDVAFYRNDNGLFEVNKNWRGYKAEMSGKKYANLQNYEKDPETGNLLVAENGVTYNYDSSVWKHAGNNGIAFYAKDKDTAEYYAYSSKKDSDRVYDLATIEGLARYSNARKTGALSMTVTGTGEWVECFFYIQAGSSDKQYRLEVWSGSRDGVTKNEADSYVAFEQISWSADSTSYTNILKENIEKAQGDMTDDEFRAAYGDIAYTTFSFFDSAKFLRYDESLDKEEVGNSYDDYDSTTYTEELAYFSYTDSSLSRTSVFVNYSAIDVEVAVDEDHDHDHDDDDSDDDDSGESETNIWLLISSLALAVVLLIAIVSLIVQRAMRRYRKKHPVAERLQKAKAKKEKKAAKQAKATANEKAEAKDENDPYND